MKPAPPVTTMLTPPRLPTVPVRPARARLATFLPFGSLRSGVPRSEHASATFLTVPRLFLSPPDVGARERRVLLEAFDSNWIAPLGPARRRVRAGVRGLRRCVGPPPRFERHRGAAPRAGAARCGPGRRRAGAVAHVRGVGERGCLRGRAAGVPRQRPRHLERRSRHWWRRSWLPAPRRTRAAGRAHRRRPLRAVRRLGPDPRVVRGIRRAGDRGRGRGAGGDVPRPPRRLVRRAERVLVQRQQDHHHERRRHARRPTTRRRSNGRVT